MGKAICQPGWQRSGLRGHTKPADLERYVCSYKPCTRFGLACVRLELSKQRSTLRLFWRLVESKMIMAPRTVMKVANFTNDPAIKWGSDKEGPYCSC